MSHKEVFRHCSLSTLVEVLYFVLELVSAASWTYRFSNSMLLAQAFMVLIDSVSQPTYGHPSILHCAVSSICSLGTN